ncbi:HAD family hydrolase [Micromonospora chersina]|uniref:HAD family hydrolase n=1 Tax=Micromonospora chersina TaxID=47854 RepID=UPI0033A9537F
MLSAAWRAAPVLPTRPLPAAPHRQRAGVQVDIRPAQAERLPLAQAEGERDRPPRAVAPATGCGHQPLHLGNRVRLNLALGQSWCLGEGGRILDEVPPAHRLIERRADRAVCLVSGRRGAAVLLHPTVEALQVLQGVTRAVEDALCAAERRAAETAEPTPYGREVIVAARQAGLAVAVVSNNSAGAVRAYLAAHRLAGHVSPVVGRPYAQPARMKPSPEPILQAVHALDESPGRCVLVGDSLSDIEGAQAAGVRVVGYANRSSKAETFRVARADVVITSMGAVARVLLDLAKG